MAFTSFPQAPMIPGNQSYETNGRPQYMQQDQRTRQSGGNLGANFSGLINSQVTVPVVGGAQVITETTSKKKKKATKSTNDKGELVVTVSDAAAPAEESTAVSSREIVEGTIYADTYNDTNILTRGVIMQTDALLNECKQDLDFIRSQRNMKGKYHYINATVGSMSGLLSTKLAAIKEINSTIKNANDAEYRRFKDMRALDTTDDNKMVMDAYSAFISAPVGAPQYNLPGTAALTGGLNGIVPANYPPEVQAGMDRGMANYLANLSPEENLMLHDNNKDIEEVLVYDQATGAKQFQWMNTKTGEMLSNMPTSSGLIIEDFTIDPRTKLAKNTNMNQIKKVVVLNEGTFGKF